MRKKSVSGVLASLRGSRRTQSTPSPLRLLRPCWTAFLRILQGGRSESSHTSTSLTATEVKIVFSAACY